MGYSQHYNTRKTPQGKPIPGRDMVANNAGGYVFSVGDEARLRRFLVLGTIGGTYYVNEAKHTQEEADFVVRMIKADGPAVVREVVSVSDRGLAPKNDHALFALALAMAFGDPTTRQLAGDALPSVARTGTHLFQFINYVTSLRGWGRGLRRAVAAWYEDKGADKLAYQFVKYQSRTVDGNTWSHRDVLRLAHPVPPTRAHDALFSWAVGKPLDGREVPALIQAYEAIKAAKTVKDVVRLIGEYKLTWEMVPGQWLGERKVWEALLPNLPYTAMIRNLGRMGALGILKPLGDDTIAIAERIRDPERVKRSRVHPMQILVALVTYQKGSGVRGRLAWAPDQNVIAALSDAFYLAFDNVEPAGKRIMLALDVSGSMDLSRIAGLPLTPREASAALSIVTMRTEPLVHLMGFSHTLVPINLSRTATVSEAVRVMKRVPMGGTDCALPMIYALEHEINVDAFVIYTDNETWFGNVHPVQALAEYRRKINPGAQLVVVAMTAGSFSIADPDDSGMLDVVGMDTSTPATISRFIAGKI